LVSSPSRGTAQTRPLATARLNASAELDSKGVFVYRYVIENGAASTAGVSKLAIETSQAGGRSAPPGLSAPQPGWRAVAGTEGNARWVAVTSQNFVLPKQRLAGFSLTSQMPPSLRRFTLAPYVDPDKAPVIGPADDPGELDRYNQELEQYAESQGVSGLTLGPAPLGPVSADTVLANLVNQLPQARSLRWITSDASARSFTEKLQAARGALARRQSEASANTLRALRTEVAAQSGKTLTSEAVALLDLNLQYVLRFIDPAFR